MWGNPLPWKKTPLTPNLGSRIETDDMRPGLGWTGVAHLQDFVRKGGLLIDVDGHGRPRRHHRLHARASRSRRASACASSAASCDRRWWTPRARSPTATATTSRSGATTARSSTSRTCSAARGGRRLGPDDGGTGRPGAARPTIRTCRRGAWRRVPEEPKAEPWEARAVTDEQLRNGINVIPPALRPRVVLRYAERASCSSRACSRTAARSRSTRRSSTSRSRRARRRVLEQPDLARRDPGQLLPGVQRAPELRPAGRGAEAGRPIGRERPEGRERQDGKALVPPLLPFPPVLPVLRPQNMSPCQ